MLAEMRRQGATVYDGEVAIVLRAIEEGARTTGRAAGSDTSYLALVARLLQVGTAAADTAPGAARPASSLILP